MRKSIADEITSVRRFIVGVVVVFLLWCKALVHEGLCATVGIFYRVRTLFDSPSSFVNFEIAMPLNLDFAKNLRFEDESPELELIERGEKFASFNDAALDERLETFKGHLKKLKLKDTRKLELHIEAIELEKLNRSKKVPELGKVTTCTPNFNVGSRQSHVNVVETDDPEKTLSKRNMCPNFATLSKNCGTNSKIGNSKKSVDTQGIPASAFYEEIHVLNESRKRQPFYNLRKFSTSSPSGVETGKEIKRTGAKGQANPTHSEPVHIEDDPSVVPKQFKETDSFMLKAHCALEKRNSKKRCQGLEKSGGTLDSALVLFSSDEEDSQGNGCITPLSEDLQHLHVRFLQSKNTEQQRCNSAKIAYPSREDPDAVEVLFSDLQQLKSMDFLNDVIIDFYIKHIQETKCTNSELKQKFYFFNTFFFKKLTEAVVLQRRKKATDAFVKVRKWTKGLDIFQKSFLFVPVHDQLHWSLAIICLQFEGFKKSPQACILHLDSMEYGHNTEALIKILKCYLEAEWNHKFESAKDPISCNPLLENIRGKKVRVPLQQNEFDCGLFLLHYIELFVEKPPLLFCYDDIDKMFGLDWFIPDEASNLRMIIRRLIESLFVKEENGRESSSGHSSQCDLGPIIME